MTDCLPDNSYWFERFRDWRGILVEPTPALAEQCRRNRPKARVFSTALVESDDTKSIAFSAAGLMGYVTGNFATLGNPDHEQVHRQQACNYQGLTEIADIQVPARALASVLEEANIGRIDLLSLDVEDYELPVFRGMNVEKHRPRFLCVETRGPDVICAALNGHYETVEQLGDSDCLFRARDA
jgi:FkbM family methyltransferase